MFQNISLCDNGLFRGIFGRVGSEEILADLINAVLRNAGETQIESLTIQNPFQLQELISQKETILDIKAIDRLNQGIDVEVQIAQHENFRERILYYWSRMYGQKLTKGSDYSELRPVISVIFTKFSIYEKNRDILYDTFHLCSKYDSSRVYSDHLKIHFITVPDNVNASAVIFSDGPLKQWLKTLNYPNKTTEEEMEDIATDNPMIKKALERTKEFIADPMVQEYIEGREKYELVQATLRRTAAKELEKQRVKGREEGRVKGREEGRAEGEAKGRVKDISVLLELRFGVLDAALHDAISGKTDDETLQALLIRAATCADLEEFKRGL